MARKRVLILTAVVTETRALAGTFGISLPRPGETTTAVRPKADVELELIGIGAKRLPADLERRKPDLLIMAGLAGALDPTLEVGDVIVDEFPPNWPRPPATRLGRIVCSKTVVSDVDQKGDLFRRTGAAAVEMEADAVRSIAQRLNIPFIHIRAISDGARQRIDPTILTFVNSFGRALPMRLAGAVIFRPKIVPGLIRLGRASGIAARNLADVVSAIIDQLPPD